MATQTFTFDTSSNYTFDTDDVEITAGKAQLKLQDNTGQTYQDAIDSDSGATYNSDEAEFTGGQVQQKSQAITDSLFGINFRVDEDMLYGIGAPSGTLGGTASVSGGKLDCTGPANKYCTWNIDNLAGTEKKGTHIFKYTPDYLGTPPSERYLMYIGKTTTTAYAITIIHSNSGNIQVYIFNSTGGALVFLTSPWSPTADQEYEICLSYDYETNGNIYLYVDKALVDSDINNAGAVTNWAGRTLTDMVYRHGTDRTGSNAADGYFDNIITFASMEETGATYTTDYTVPAYLYTETQVDLAVIPYTDPGEIQLYTNLVATSVNSPKFIMDGEYWTGSAWAASDGTYAQANTTAELVTNFPTLAPDTLLYQLSVIFQDSDTQGNLSEYTITYTGQAYPTDEPTVEINSTWYLDDLEYFTETSTKTGSDEIKYILKKGATWYYWSGSAWVESDGTYSQSNTAAEIETNKASFASVRTLVAVKLFLHSNDGTTTPDVDTLAIQYNYAGESVSDINTCIVWGKSVNPDNSVNTDSITATLNKDTVQYKTDIVIDNSVITATPDSTGYWEIELIESANMESDTSYLFTVNGIQYDRDVPNEATKQFWELT